MLLKELIQTGIQTISHLYSEIEAREMVLAYLCDTLGIKRHTHIIEPQYEVEGEKVRMVMTAFERLASGEPLQYVTGKAYFYGREFRVTSDTLIPRPETELLCRMAVEAAVKPNPRVLDLCTGSGCIAWTLALELPKAEVDAVDISDGALAVASSQDFTEETSVTGASVPTFIKTDVLAGPSFFEIDSDEEYDDYDDLNDDEDFECDDDSEYFELECPSCGEVICFDSSLDTDSLVCPACGEKIEDIEICDGNCEECDDEECEGNN